MPLEGKFIALCLLSRKHVSLSCVKEVLQRLLGSSSQGIQVIKITVKTRHQRQEIKSPQIKNLTFFILKQANSTLVYYLSFSLMLFLSSSLSIGGHKDQMRRWEDAGLNWQPVCIKLRPRYMPGSRMNIRLHGMG